MPYALRGVLSLMGRVLLCAIFLMAALANKIPHFGDVAEIMRKVGVPAPELMLVGAIVFLLVGGVSVLIGWQARLGALLLLIFLALATYYFHPFWALPAEVAQDPQAVQNQMAHGMKNVALMGAMLFIIANGPGAWSIDERRASRTKGVGQSSPTYGGAVAVSR
jgi:putative oxidoreductase